MATYVLQPFQSATAIFRGPADHGTIVLTVKGFAPEFNHGFQLDELSKAPDLVIAVRAWSGPHSQKLAGFTAHHRFPSSYVPYLTLVGVTGTMTVPVRVLPEAEVEDSSWRAYAG